MPLAASRPPLSAKTAALLAFRRLDAPEEIDLTQDDEDLACLVGAAWLAGGLGQGAALQGALLPHTGIRPCAAMPSRPKSSA